MKVQRKIIAMVVIVGFVLNLNPVKICAKEINNYSIENVSIDNIYEEKAYYLNEGNCDVYYVDPLLVGTSIYDESIIDDENFDIKVSLDASAYLFGPRWDYVFSSYKVIKADLVL